jgi:hypothetical protein
MTRFLDGPFDTAGPEVRILFPPAASPFLQWTTGLRAKSPATVLEVEPAELIGLPARQRPPNIKRTGHLAILPETIVDRARVPRDPSGSGWASPLAHVAMRELW